MLPKVAFVALCAGVLLVCACQSNAAAIGDRSGLPGLDGSVSIDDVTAGKLPFFMSWMLKYTNVSAKVKTQWAELNANVTFPSSGPSRCTEQNGTLLGDIVACPYSTVHISDGLLDRPVHYQVGATTQLHGIRWRPDTTLNVVLTHRPVVHRGWATGAAGDCPGFRLADCHHVPGLLLG